jgi:hypothetical protein
MSTLLKFRLPALVVLFLLIGLALSTVLRFEEMKWYYIGATPFIALIIGLLGNFFTDSLWSNKGKSKSGFITAILALAFLVALVFHVSIYSKSTFRYDDVNNVSRTYIKGYDYTDLAMRFKAKDSTISSDKDLLHEGFGGIDGIADAWTAESIRKSTLKLTISYIVTVLLLSALMSWVLGTAWERRFSDPQKAVKAILEEKDISNYNKYLLTFTGKRTEEKYKMIKAHIFLSYASKQRKIAEELAYSLNNSGHMVFFDRSNLAPALGFNEPIHSAINHSDIFIFLISPDSVAEGHYTLSELKFASEKWPAANGVLLPVMAEPTEFINIPAYAQSVTILFPKGNLVAEVTAEADRLYSMASRVN